MRLKHWNPEKYDSEFMGITMKKLREAAEVVAAAARNSCPVGTISRPVYKSGRYAGKSWTARVPESLRKSIRVTELKEAAGGIQAARLRNVRVYAGHYNVAYARIVENNTGFLKKALSRSKGQIRNILEDGK